MLLFTPLLLISIVEAGIEIPRDSCRWMSASNWETELKCDGNEVVIGLCSGGGGGGNKDCPGDTVHQIQCCGVPEYYYSGCNTYGSNWGQNIDCRDHGQDLVSGGSVCLRRECGLPWL